MSFFHFLKRLFFSIDAEKAHCLALWAIKNTPGSFLRYTSRYAHDDLRLRTKAFGINFANPVCLAAGFDKHAEIPNKLLALGFSAVEVGSVTPQPQEGNVKPRVFRLLQDEAIINRYGLNSVGCNAVRKKLRRYYHNGIVGINLGPNKDTIDRAEDYVFLMRSLAGHCDYYAINISSPNTPGLRDMQETGRFDSLLARLIDTREELRDRGMGAPLLIKIAPDLSDGMIEEMVRIARLRGVDGMIVSNTTIARPVSLREKRLSHETGGLSGRPLFDLATRVLAKTALHVESAFPIIGVGGVDSGQAALLKIEAGASLVQLYTGFIFRGPALIEEIKRTICDTLTQENLDSITPLIGRRAREIAAGAALSR